MFELLRQDCHRYHRAVKPIGPRIMVLRVLLTYGFMAACVYRYGRWANRIRPHWLAVPFKVLYVLLYVPTELIFGITYFGQFRYRPATRDRSLQPHLRRRCRCDFVTLVSVFARYLPATGIASHTPYPSTSGK